MSTSNSSRCIFPSLWPKKAIIIHIFHTPTLSLNPSAWNDKGDLHSEKLFHFYGIEYEKIYIQTPDVEFWKWKLVKYHLASLDLSTRQSFNTSSSPSQCAPGASNWYHGVWGCRTQPAGRRSLCLASYCWEKGGLDLLRTADSKETWAY